MELSTQNTDVISLSPRLLCCLRCHAGGGCPPDDEAIDFSAILQRIKNNPDTHVRLDCAFDHCGARTQLYNITTPEQRKRDLDVLYRIGFVPGDTRTARDLFSALDRFIPSVADICDYPNCHEGMWTACVSADKEFYKNSSGFIAWPQNPEKMACAKRTSCTALSAGGEIDIRPHHLLCLICFNGRDDNDHALAEDNLFEVLSLINQNPSIVLHLVDGPSECMICPPCHAFRADRGVCVALCHLRDRKKDLETLCRLGLLPGDRITAQEAFKRIRQFIPTTDGICGLSSPNQFEWADCGGVTDGRYQLGYQKLFG